MRSTWSARFGGPTPEVVWAQAKLTAEVVFAAGHTGPVKTSPEDAIENMTVIDAIYGAAGQPLREPS
jgi:hypothetical protein